MVVVVARGRFPKPHKASNTARKKAPPFSTTEKRLPFGVTGGRAGQPLTPATVNLKSPNLKPSTSECESGNGGPEQSQP